MADIEKITLPNGDSYDIKDSNGRTLINSIDTRVTALEVALDNLVTQDQTTGVLTIGGGNQDV